MRLVGGHPADPEFGSSVNPINVRYENKYTKRSSVLLLRLVYLFS